MGWCIIVSTNNTIHTYHVKHVEDEAQTYGVKRERESMPVMLSALPEYGE
jgi:hypothetical protein